MFNSPPAGMVYSVNKQCQFVFGPSAEICPYMVDSYFRLILSFFSQHVEDYGVQLITDFKWDVEHNTRHGSVLFI
jgi:hypothetical protein